MANTVIQLKYSTVTTSPSALNVAEPAYSYTSNTLFIGSPSGTGAIAIGGKFYLDQQQNIYDYANAAFAQANAAGSSAFAQAAFNTANASFNHANAGFQAANSAGSYANSAFSWANTVYSSYAYPAYVNTLDLAGVNITQNNSIAAAFTAANSGGSYANSAFIHSNAAFDKANTVGLKTDAAFIRANNSLDANNGGTVTGTVTISGDFNVTGNLTITGNTTTHDVNSLNISDPLIYLAANNYTSDLVDIGFVGNYYDGSVQRHAGLIRHASDGNFYLFTNYDEEPTNNIIDINDASFRKGTLYANVNATTATIGGVDIKTYVDNAFNAANTADSKAVSAGTYANGAFVAANTADDKATSAGIYANGAFIAANTADSKAVSAGSYANSAFTTANAAQAHAAAAFSLANGTAIIANTDYTTITTTAGYYGNGATIASFTLEANGRISQANSTLIGISASQVTVGTLPVARGGTGAGTFTTNGVLLGQGTSAFTTASSSTEGHVLTINASGVPTFAHLQGGTF